MKPRGEIRAATVATACLLVATSCASSEAVSGAGGESAETGGGGSGAQSAGGGTSTGGASTGGAGGAGGAGGGGGMGAAGGGGCGPSAHLDPAFGAAGLRQIAMVGAVGGTASDLDRDYGRTIALAPSGAIVFGGEWYSGTSYDFALVRLTANGALDPTFDGDGKVTQHGFPAPAPIRGVVVDAAGNAIVAAALSSFDRPYGIARFTSAGAPDTSFGGTGFVTTAVAHPQADSVTAFQPIGIQSNGKVIIGGGDTTGSSDFQIARYDTSGQLDTTFGVGGTATIAVTNGLDIITSLRVMPDDRIVAAGVGNKNQLPWEAGDFAVAVLQPDGTPDTSFNGSGFTSVNIYPEGARPNGVIMQPDGKVVAIGCLSCDYNYASKVSTVVVRWQANGALDPSFSQDGIVEISFDALIDIGYDVVVAPDGKLVISGGLAVQQQVGKMYVARLLPDGSLDLCFAPNGVISSYPTQGFTGNDQGTSLALSSDGSILVGGALGYSTWGDFAVMKLTF